MTKAKSNFCKVALSTVLAGTLVLGACGGLLNFSSASAAPNTGDWNAKAGDDWRPFVNATDLTFDATASLDKDGYAVSYEGGTYDGQDYSVAITVNKAVYTTLTFSAWGYCDFGPDDSDTGVYYLNFFIDPNNSENAGKYASSYNTDVATVAARGANSNAFDAQLLDEGKAVLKCTVSSFDAYTGSPTVQILLDVVNHQNDFTFGLNAVRQTSGIEPHSFFIDYVIDWYKGGNEWANLQAASGINEFLDHIKFTTADFENASLNDITRLGIAPNIHVLATGIRIYLWNLNFYWAEDADGNEVLSTSVENVDDPSIVKWYEKEYYTDNTYTTRSTVITDYVRKGAEIVDGEGNSVKPAGVTKHATHTYRGFYVNTGANGHAFKTGDMVILEKGLRYVNCPDGTYVSAEYYNGAYVLSRTQAFVYTESEEAERSGVWSKDIYAVEEVALDKESGTAEIGGNTLALTASVTGAAGEQYKNYLNTQITWSSSDTSIATVNENGVVTGVAKGTAVITATSVADGTKAATCEVTVIGATDPASVSVTLSASSVAVGGNVTATAQVTGGSQVSQDVVWSSSDETIATVDATGKVTAIKEGTVYIVATAKDSTVYGRRSLTVTAAASDNPGDDDNKDDNKDDGKKKGGCGSEIGAYSLMASCLALTAIGAVVIVAKKKEN